MEEDEYTNEEIAESGSLVDMYPCDLNEYGERESNGSQMFVYRHLGKYYEVQVDWDGDVIYPDSIAHTL